MLNAPNDLKTSSGRACILVQQPLEPETALDDDAERILINKFGQLRKIMLGCAVKNVICFFH
jgi:hypothetical protein